jgi:hypothetical protein
MSKSPVEANVVDVPDVRVRMGNISDGGYLGGRAERRSISANGCNCKGS